MTEESDTREYQVVVNQEEQYSIWLAGKSLPPGWQIVPIPGEWLERQPEQTSSRQTCLNYIEEIWTDMRPLSLRKAMAEND